MSEEKSPHNFSEREFQFLKQMVQKMGPPIPHKIFRLIAHRFVLTPVEAVVLRKKDSKIQVLLIKRDPDDPDWGGQLHSPGTILRANDEDGKRSYSSALRRLEERELKTKFSKPPILITPWFHRGNRGIENAMIFLCQIKGDPPVGKFYNIDSLPKNIIKSQVGFIKLTAKEAIAKKFL